MRFALILCCGAMGLLSACTTVDLADMGPVQAAQTAEIQDNVVIRASEKLVSNFTKNGWAEAPDPRRMQKAASIFLTGMRAVKIAPDNSYAGRAESLAGIRADIQAASAMMTRPIKAADVYLTMAADGADLGQELESLEAAISASHKAEMNFTQALKKFKSADPAADLAPLKATANQLGRIANQYGARVRASAANYGDVAS